jgi:RHS repeat-associated protein
MNDDTVIVGYDGDGNRVSKTARGVTTTYLIDMSGPTGYAQAVEERSGGTVARSYVYGPQLISMKQSGVWAFYTADGQMNVRALTDGSGAVTDTWDYDAFGTMIGGTGRTSNNLTFASEYNDPDLGLVYLRARWMNPAAGRFWTRDGFEGIDDSPLTLAPYLYGSQQPTGNIDQSGNLSSTLEIGQMVHDNIQADFEAWCTKTGRFPCVGDLSMKRLFGLPPNTNTKTNSITGLNPLKNINRLRPDLIDFSSRELYEIKPIGYKDGGIGAAQLLLYVTLANMFDPLGPKSGGKAWSVGTSYSYCRTLLGPSSGGTNTNPMPIFLGFAAGVFPTFAGMIFYDVLDPNGGQNATASFRTAVEEAESEAAAAETSEVVEETGDAVAFAAEGVP